MEKFYRIIVMAILVLGIASCQEDDRLFVETTTPEGVDVKMLESWSYEVPLEVKSNGEWTTETSGDWFYLLPEKGNGNGIIEICVLDNTTERRQQGTIKIVAKDGTSTTIEIQQKSEADYDENLSMANKGYAKYVVGYGYNATKKEYPSPKCLTQQIVKFKTLWEADEVGFDTSVSEYSERTITGSSFEELSNKLNVTASLTGDYGGFSGEVSTSFNMNNYSSGSHEFAMTYIDYEVGVISISLSTDDLKGYLTTSAKKAINGEGKYSDARELIKEYGTHLVVKADVGGKLRHNMAVDITKVTGSYDLHAFAKASYSGFGISMDGSVTDDLKKSYENNKQNCEFSFTAYGGNSKALTISSDSKAITAWKESLNYDDNYNLALINIQDSYLVPIQDLVTLEKDTDQRVAAIKTAIEELSKTGTSGSYNSGTEVKIKIPDFSKASQTTSLIKEVKIDGEVKAWICNEYIPVIDKDARVTVIYPVINNKPRFNLGYFIGNASHKPARVSWTGEDALYIKELELAAFGANSTVYIKGASVNPTQNTEKVFDGKVADYTLGMKICVYPLVKIFGNVWLRRNYYEEMSGAGTSLYHWLTNNNIVGHAYHYSTVNDPNFAPAGWKVASGKDYERIENMLEANGIATVGKYFRSGNNSPLGFEAPVFTDPNIAYWFDDLGGGNHNKGVQNEYFTSDGKHVRMRNDGFAIENADDIKNYRMPVRLVMEQK